MDPDPRVDFLSYLRRVKHCRVVVIFDLDTLDATTTHDPWYKRPAGVVGLGILMPVLAGLILRMLLT